ncbi:hypothetical protein ARMGADRAFT_1037646 [Armillaria gallica]|uniref:Uncharacterized protein n=1 Tax=Armillaria gallica TaxID=47427 RepID=A0A2H3CLC2_ARMGA|nr:hypothetical protein ARMGADRAFT_1037646 [Armillaria gallica]
MRCQHPGEGLGVDSTTVGDKRPGYRQQHGDKLPVYCRDNMRRCIACMTVECGTVVTGLLANRPTLRLKAAVPGNTRSKQPRSSLLNIAQVRAVYKPTAIDISQLESRMSQTHLDGSSSRELIDTKKNDTFARSSLHLGYLKYVLGVFNNGQYRVYVFGVCSKRTLMYGGQAQTISCTNIGYAYTFNV